MTSSLESTTTSAMSSTYLKAKMRIFQIIGHEKLFVYMVLFQADISSNGVGVSE